SDSYEISQVTPENNESARLAKAWADISGNNLVIVKAKNQDADLFNGFIDEKTNTIYLNENADNPLHIVTAHEITHDMKRSTPEIYKSFVEEIKTFVGLNGGIEQWHNDRHPGRQWSSLTNTEKESRMDEFIADLMI